MTYFKKMGRRVLAMTMAVCLSLGLICGISFVGNTVKEVKAADTGFTKTVLTSKIITAKEVTFI